MSMFSFTTLYPKLNTRKHTPLDHYRASCWLHMIIRLMINIFYNWKTLSKTSFQRSATPYKQVERMTNLVLFHRTLAAAARVEDLVILLSADESIASRKGVTKKKLSQLKFKEWRQYPIFPRMDNWPSIPDLPLPSSRLLVSKAFRRQKSEDEKEINGVSFDLPIEQLFSSHRIDNITIKKGEWRDWDWAPCVD